MNADEIKAALSSAAGLVFPALPDGIQETPEQARLRTVPASLLLSSDVDGDRTLIQPVRLRNAIIEGDLDLSHFEIEQDFQIENSTFTGVVNLSMATFQHAASFTGSRFEGAFLARATRVNYDLDMRACHFLREVTLIDADVREVLSCEGTIFGARVNFDRIHVGKAAVFASQGGPGAEFHREASFHSANFGGHLVCSHCIFDSNAVFDGLAVSKAAFFDSAVFKGPSRLTGATIGEQLACRGAVFLASSKFEQIVVKGTTYFQPDAKGTATSFADVSFGGSSFHGQTVFTNAEFGESLFFNSKFGSDLIFNAVTFRENVRLERIHVGSGLFFDKTVFSKDMHLVSSVAAGPVSFRETTCKGNMRLENSQFHGILKFEGRQSQRCHFSGKVDFRLAHFIGGLACTFSSFDETVDFSSSQFGKLLYGHHIASMNVRHTTFDKEGLMLVIEDDDEEPAEKKPSVSVGLPEAEDEKKSG